MKSERFDRAVKALVKGYLNGTLKKGRCSMCAVGNIVYESGEFEKPITVDLSHTYWSDVFSTQFGHQLFDLDNYDGQAKKLIDSTGYSVEELARVEKAFETNTKILSVFYEDYSPQRIDEDQLNGLYAVVDVLCEIEGIEEEADSYKQLFKKEAVL